MNEWFRNLFSAVKTVAEGMLVTLRVFGSTYDQTRRTFTEHFEYPELPAPVAAARARLLAGISEGVGAASAAAGSLRGTPPAGHWG